MDAKALGKRNEFATVRHLHGELARPSLVGHSPRGGALFAEKKRNAAKGNNRRFRFGVWEQSRWGAAMK